MRQSRHLHTLSACAFFMLASAARAGSLDEAAIHAQPQYYLMALPAAPVGEIAEAVLGEALGLPFKVDDDVDVQMRFQVDGMYAPKALAQEFGYRLWNADVALIEKPSDGLWLIPKSELAAAQAQGATLVSPLAAAEARAVPKAAPVLVARQESKPAPDWSWMGWLIAGWAAGAASVIGWMASRKRRPPATCLLTAPAVASSEPDPDDLVIPTFGVRTKAASQPKPL